MPNKNGMRPFVSNTSASQRELDGPLHWGERVLNLRATQVTQRRHRTAEWEGLEASEGEAFQANPRTELKLSARPYTRSV